MFGNVVLDIEKHDFDADLRRPQEESQGQVRYRPDRGRSEGHHRRLQEAGPEEDRQSRSRRTRVEQLAMSRDAVFRSWFNARAIHYRKMNKIPDDLGTAVNVQAMVFGNLGDTSATGVGFTRNPSTGEKAFYGEFLMNAQGEDVVAGIRTPQPIAELENRDARCLQPAPRDHQQPGKALPRHAGFRVHRAGRQAVHAADPQRQAHRSGGGADRGGDGGRRLDHEEKWPSAASIRSSSISCCTRCSIPLEEDART